MKSRSPIILAAAATVLVCAQVASAHPGHGQTGGLAAGIAHPFSGLDHILAMIAVGFCAVRGGRRMIWLLPTMFMAFMLAGGAMGIHRSPVPMIEQGIAVSVLLMGLLVAADTRVALPVSAGLIAIFGLIHGYAHGVEMAASLSPAAYALGFLLATACLHLIGIGAGLLIRSNRAAMISRLAGGAIAACGVVLIWMA